MARKPVDKYHKKLQGITSVSISKRSGIAVHKITLSLPEFEMFEGGSRIRRSSKSVAAMIVEGYGRKRYKAEFIRYLVSAKSECDETIVHPDFLFDTGSLTDKDAYSSLRNEYDLLSKQPSKFSQWAEEKFEYKTSKSTGHQPTGNRLT